LDQASGLVIGGSGETENIVLGGVATNKPNDAHLGLASGDDGVARNYLGENTTGGLNAKGKCAHIDKDDILSALLSREDTTLNSSTVCNSLIRVDALRWLLSKVFFKELLNLGYTRGTADKYDLVQVLKKPTTDLLTKRYTPHQFPPSSHWRP